MLGQEIPEWKLRQYAKEAAVPERSLWITDPRSHKEIPFPRPTRGDTQLDLLFTSKGELPEDVVISGRLG